MTELRPANDNYTVMAKLKCTSCQEEHAKYVGFSKDDEVEMSKGRSSSNLVMHCQVRYIEFRHSQRRKYIQSYIHFISILIQFCKKEISASKWSKYLMMILSYNAHHSPPPSTFFIEFEEPTAKAPLWRPYAPSAGATFETIAIVDARGLDFLSIDFSVCIWSLGLVPHENSIDVSSLLYH